MAADGQSDNTAPNVEVQMKQKRVSACRKSVVIALTDIHLHLLNQTVDVSIVRWWVVCFSSGNSRSPPLVQILKSTACRLLFIAGKNGQLIAVTMLK